MLVERRIPSSQHLSITKMWCIHTWIGVGMMVKVGENWRVITDST